MIRLSDYIGRYLADHGISHAFMVTGGASMHLNACLWRSIQNQGGFLSPRAALRDRAGNPRSTQPQIQTGPPKIRANGGQGCFALPPLPLKGIFDYQQWTISLKREEYHSYNVGSD
jgi:hypothetical protein